MLTVVVVAAAVAGSDCRPAEPARLRLEHVAMAIDRTGVHIAFELVNDGGHDAYVFTTSHGTLYDESTRVLTLFARQHPFRPTGTTGDMHFFLQPFERVRPRQRRSVAIDLPRFVDGIDLSDRSLPRWLHDPVYQAQSLHLEVGWSERPFDDAFRDATLADAHQEMADRVFALQRGVLVADAP